MARLSPASIHRPIKREEAQKLVEGILSHKPHALSILDYGCGYGMWSQMLKQLSPGSHVTGIDCSSQAIMHAKGMVEGVALMTREEWDISEPEKTYDLIVVRDLLCWLSLSEATFYLLMLYPRLAPGGVLWANMYNWEKPEMRKPLLSKGGFSLDCVCTPNLFRSAVAETPLRDEYRLVQEDSTEFFCIVSKPEEMKWDTINVKSEVLPKDYYDRTPEHVRSYFVEVLRKQEQSKKEVPPILEKGVHTLSTTPSGLGDVCMLTAPWGVGQEASVWHYSQWWRDMQSFCHVADRNTSSRFVMADAWNRDFNLGSGHFLQRLQRLVVAEKDIQTVPRPQLTPASGVEHNPKQCVLHFEAGAHVGWQKRKIHPRAREIYRETFSALQKFIDDKSGNFGWSFVEVGRSFSGLRNVTHIGRPAFKDLWSLMCSSGWFIGIVSGPMHLAAAAGLRSVVILNFPEPEKIVLPTMVNRDQVEEEWLYPQNVHLHQDGGHPFCPKLSYCTLHMAVDGLLYPYWNPVFPEMIKSCPV